MTHSHAAPQGIRSPGILARYPLIGLGMLLLGGLVFALLAHYLRRDGDLVQWDMMNAKMFRAAQIRAPWPWMEDILFGGYVGKEVVILIGAALAAYFLHKRFWRELAMLLAGLSGGGLIWYLLSRYFDRPRPADQLQVLQLSGPSFPSGPAVMAILCYGLLGYFLIPWLPSVIWKWFAALMCALAVAIVALSSLLFGAHYATDVIAGSAVGVAWVGLAYTLSELVTGGREPGEREIPGELAFQGLHSPGFFGRRPVMGLGLIVLSSPGLAALGYNLLARGPLVELDMSVYKGLLPHAVSARPLVNDIMLFGFFVGKQAVQILVAILSLYFLYQRYWRDLAIIQFSTQGGGIIWNFLIDFFARPRPPQQLGLATSAIPSFPSGHALGTLIGYGFLAYLLIPRMPSRLWKWGLGLGILSLVLFEGFSRIFHGNHYLTDVLAGYLLGIAWLVSVCTAIESVFPKKQT